MQWTDERGAKWEVEIELRAVDGTVVPTGLKLSAMGHTEPLDVTHVLRCLPMGTLVREAERDRWQEFKRQAFVASLDTSPGDALGEQVVREAQDRVAEDAPLFERRKRRRRGRPTVVTDGDLVRVSAIYRAHSKAPVRAVERELGITREQASYRIRLAKERGLLDGGRG